MVICCQVSTSYAKLSCFMMFAIAWHTISAISKPMVFAKPMVCTRVAFRENDRKHENDKNDKDNPYSYKPKNKESSAG